jgi:hypothetical protein
MMNLILVLLCLIGTYYLTIFIESKIRESAKIKAINLAHKCLDEFRILSFEEIKNIKDTPFNPNELEPDFAPYTNLFNFRFYFKVKVQKESETLIKWVYAFYFLNFKVIVTIL